MQIAPPIAKVRSSNTDGSGTRGAAWRLRAVAFREHYRRDAAASSVETRTLGRGGPALPVVGMGSWRVFDVEGTAAEEGVRRVVGEAFDAGTRVFDTSPMYGRAERVLAGALGPMRSSAFVATKVWARNAAEAREQVDRALRWYGGRVDLYQVHNLENIDEVLPMLERARDAGQVAKIGVTHYQESRLPEVRRWMESGRVDAVQIPFNPTRGASEREVLPTAERLGLGVLVMSPFETGELLARGPGPGLKAKLDAAGIRSWPEALLRWILADPRVTVVLPATSRPGRPSENARAGQPRPLDPALRDEIGRAAR
jgi:diketogulonate reductase-like aldo/keto reductase